MTNIERFEELLKSDEALQARLQELVGAFEGDKSDAAAVFAATVGKLAEEAGLPFGYEEGREYSSNRELSDEELEAVAGGKGFCYIVGGSNKPEAECDTAYGFACAYGGITFGDS